MGGSKFITGLRSGHMHREDVKKCENMPSPSQHCMLRCADDHVIRRLWTNGRRTVLAHAMNAARCNFQNAGRLPHTLQPSLPTYLSLHPSQVLILICIHLLVLKVAFAAVNFGSARLSSFCFGRGVQRWGGLQSVIKAKSRQRQIHEFRFYLRMFCIVDHLFSNLLFNQHWPFMAPKFCQRLAADLQA